MLCAALAIGDTGRRRDDAWWTLVLGGMAGLTLSMAFPAMPIAIIAIVALSAGRLRARLPWLAAAAVIALLISGGHVLHLFQQFALSPETIARRDHPEPSIAVLLWSTFLRPVLGVGEPPDWRTVFLGPPFAVAAVASLALPRLSSVRPLLVGLACGVLGLVVPPDWLFDVRTAQWLYRTQVNVFGIVLAVCAVHHWVAAAPRWRRWLPRLVAVQMVCLAVTVLPVWYPVMARSLMAADSRRTAVPAGGVAEAIAARYAERPGRVLLGPQAEDASRRLPNGGFVLAPNQLQIAGVPAVSASVWGLTTDALYPGAALMEGEFRGETAMIQNDALLDVLGVRYVVGFRDDAPAAGLREVEAFTPDVRLYENEDAWPEAFFVDRLPQARVPRLAGCSHDRFLCADFSEYAFGRRTDPIDVTRVGDGVRLSFTADDATRYIVLTHWYNPDWQVTVGRASLTAVAEQFIGIRLEPGESSVTLRYRPVLRRVLFAAGLVTEMLVGVGLFLLAWQAVRTPRRGAPRRG
jgi:hypothetical protein